MVLVAVNLFGIANIKLSMTDLDTVADVKALVHEATGISGVKLQHKGGYVLIDSKETMALSEHTQRFANADGEQVVFFEASSPTNDALRIANQLKKLQVRASESPEGFIVEGELTVTKNSVSLTSHQILSDQSTLKDAPTSSEPPVSSSSLLPEQGHRDILNQLNDRIAVLESEIKQKKADIKNAVNQIRDVRVPIQLRQPSGNLISITTVPSQKVSECKSADVAPVLGVHPNHVRLLCEGELMRDGKRLFSYKVGEGTILDCIILGKLTEAESSSESESQPVKIDDTETVVANRFQTLVQGALALQDEIKVNVTFTDMSKEWEPTVGGFNVRIDPKASVVTLSIRIIEDIIPSDSFKRIETLAELNLSECTFKQVLYYNDEPMLPAFKSIESFGVRHNDVVEMRCFEEGDKRFEDLHLNVMPKKTIIELNPADDDKNMRLVVQVPDEYGFKRELVFFFGSKTKAPELFNAINEFTGLEQSDYGLFWSNGASKVEHFDTCSSYFGNGDCVQLIPKALGGGKAGKVVKTILKERTLVSATDKAIFDNIIVQSCKLASLKTEDVKGVFDSLSVEVLTEMAEFLENNRTNTIPKVMTLIGMIPALKEMDGAIVKIASSLECARDVVFSYLKEKCRGESGDLSTPLLKKFINVRLAIKEEAVENTSDVHMG